MSKVYKIVQVHLRNEEADLALTAMLRGAEWEFVCCVPIRDDILAYTFRRDLIEFRRKSSSHPEPGIRKAPKPTTETQTPAPKLEPPTQPATYKGKVLLCKNGQPLLIPCDERIVRTPNSSQVISNKGNVYSRFTGRLVNQHSKS